MIRIGRMRMSRLQALAAASVVIFITVISVGAHRLVGQSYLSVTPSRYSECLGSNIVSHVKWDMRGKASGKVVFVSAYRVGMFPTVFAKGGVVGEVDTGDWVSDGTTVMVSDEANRVLAKRTVESVDCPAVDVWKK